MAEPDLDLETTSDPFLGTKGCCFSIPCFGSRRSRTFGSAWFERTQTAQVGSNQHEDKGWWTRGLMKIREWSEITAGPKWKTFIRRYNRVDRRGEFQYDPLSYALNFDENGDSEEDDGVGYGGLRSFSTRYASVPLGSSGRFPPPGTREKSVGVLA